MRLPRFLSKRKPSEIVSYIDVEPVLSAARAAGLSINDYRERVAFDESGDKRFLGRRDRVYSRLSSIIGQKKLATILEIGPGAGAFTEVFLRDYPEVDYQIYELRNDWREYLCRNFGVRGMPCDGISLASTPSVSVDLVHCHATFVYIPMLATLRYLQECARVLRDGGMLIMDVYTEDEMPYETAIKTIHAKHQFHTIIPGKLLSQFFEAGGLNIVDTFCEHHTATVESRYYVLKKQCG